VFDSAETDALWLERKSDKVVTMLADNAEAKTDGEGFLPVRVGHVTLKDLDGRLLEEQLGGIYPGLRHTFEVDSHCERAQRCQATRLRTSSTQR
jgi:hypothetical protein